MAQVRTLEGKSTEGVWIESGKDHGKPVRYKVRAIPFEVDRRLYREAYRDTKARNVGKQSAASVVEKMEDYTRARAVYALVDTENFSDDRGSAEAAAAHATKTGGTVQFETEVLLDGHWTDELKADVLERARKRAAWISNQADKLTEAEVEESEAEAEDF